MVKLSHFCIKCFIWDRSGNSGTGPIAMGTGPPPLYSYIFNLLTCNTSNTDAHLGAMCYPHVWLHIQINTFLFLMIWWFHINIWWSLSMSKGSSFNFYFKPNKYEVLIAGAQEQFFLLFLHVSLFFVFAFFI